MTNHSSLKNTRSRHILVCEACACILLILYLKTESQTPSVGSAQSCRLHGRSTRHTVKHIRISWTTFDGHKDLISAGRQHKLLPLLVLKLKRLGSGGFLGGDGFSSSSFFGILGYLFLTFLSSFPYNLLGDLLLRSFHGLADEEREPVHMFLSQLAFFCSLHFQGFKFLLLLRDYDGLGISSRCLS
ncbi:hypothetical protein BKA56DRAFT_314484 [Ilyonectria sp. MPI-CAGE-AT-0026]|nr:hypothetical protein BKA56DRAFT_314484 [Ilyonectria sp. MPI-CAGE-AT-0026]